MFSFRVAGVTYDCLGAYRVPSWRTPSGEKKAEKKVSACAAKPLNTTEIMIPPGTLAILLAATTAHAAWIDARVPGSHRVFHVPSDLAPDARPELARAMCRLPSYAGHHGIAAAIAGKEVDCSPVVCSNTGDDTNAAAAPVYFEEGHRDRLTATVEGTALSFHLPTGGDDEEARQLAFVDTSLDSLADSVRAGDRALVAAGAKRKIARVHAAERACAALLEAKMDAAIGDGIADGGNGDGDGDGSLRLQFVEDWKAPAGGGRGAPGGGAPIAVAAHALVPLEVELVAPALRQPATFARLHICFQSLWFPGNGNAPPLFFLECQAAAEGLDHPGEGVGGMAATAPIRLFRRRKYGDQGGAPPILLMKREGLHHVTVFAYSSSSGGSSGSSGNAVNRASPSPLMGWASVRINVTGAACPTEDMAHYAYAAGGAPPPETAGSNNNNKQSRVDVFDQLSSPFTHRWARLRHVAYNATSDRILVFDDDPTRDRSGDDDDVLLASELWGAWRVQGERRRGASYDEARCAAVFAAPTLWAYVSAAKNRIHWLNDLLLDAFAVARRAGLPPAGHGAMRLVVEPETDAVARALRDAAHWSRAWARAVLGDRAPRVWVRAATYERASVWHGVKASEQPRGGAPFGPPEGLVCFRDLFLGTDRRLNPWHFALGQRGGAFLGDQEDGGGRHCPTEALTEHMLAFKRRLADVVFTSSTSEPDANTCAGDDDPRGDPFPLREHRVTFIERTQSRRLLNLDALAGVARSLGARVTVARLEDLPWRAQARLFRNTTVLVGVHGQGFYGQFFMQPGAASVLLLPPRFWGRRFTQGNYGVAGGLHVFPHAEPCDEDPARSDEDEALACARWDYDNYVEQEGQRGWHVVHNIGTDVAVREDRFAALLGRAMEAAAPLLRNKEESAAGAGDGLLPPAGYPVGPDGERDAAAFGGYPGGALSDEQWEAFTEGW